MDRLYPIASLSNCSLLRSTNSESSASAASATRSVGDEEFDAVKKSAAVSSCSPTNRLVTAFFADISASDWSTDMVMDIYLLV